MSLRRLLPLIVALLINQGVAGRAEAAVWIALSEGSKEYAETAEAIRQGLLREKVIPGGVRIKPWQEISVGVPAEVSLLVSVGTQAFVELVAASASGRLNNTPIIASLIPKNVFDAARKRIRTPNTAVLLDQPASRQMQLLHYAFPARKVGALLGPISRLHATALSESAANFNVRFASYQVVDSAAVYPTLQRLLDENEVLLAIPDSTIYHNASIQNILLAAYRHRIPLVGFSPAYVRAGATLALYSSPTQIGKQTVALICAALEEHSLPAPQYPKEFQIGVNLEVARSLGLRLSEETLNQKMHRGESP